MNSRQLKRFVITVTLAIGTQVSAQQPTLISVNGRQMEVVQMGQGSPTLVLESSEGDARQWTRILPELARQTHVISYSRSGFGKSDPPSSATTPQSSVSELHQLLQVLGTTGPVILAGHSWGGMLARLYVSTFRADVVGLVLVDGLHEAQHARWQTLNPGFSLDDAVRRAGAQAPPAIRNLLEQIIKVQAAQHVEGMKPLPDFPIAVITAVKPCASGPPLAWSCSNPNAIAMWRQMHAEWAARSTRSVHIVSAGTGHQVMNEEPTLIVDAVKFVLDQVRASTP
jgi:pimeloyl-ACP methyl ester carboxylesterase